MTLEDYYGFAIAQLNERYGTIESLEDIDGHLKIVSATAPLAQMLGYDKVLAETTRNSATVEGTISVRPTSNGLSGIGVGISMWDVALQRQKQSRENVSRVVPRLQGPIRRQQN